MPEIDIALKKFKRLNLVGEVKWRSDVKQKDIDKMAEKLKNFDAYKIIFVPSRAELKEPKGIKIIDAKDIIEICEGKIENIILPSK